MNGGTVNEGQGALTYRRAGVDIDAGNEAVKRILPHARRTRRPGAGEIGGFGGLFRLDPRKYPEPVLVSSTDGVGTKLKIAFALNRHDTVGQDLVAMCANDVVVQGAEPLFFLDYLGIGELDPARVEEVVKGIADGCSLAGCALTGGETAELPGLYRAGEYDLAGFCVGVANAGSLIDGSGVAPGDAVVGLSSTGLHSNGYSLARKVFLDRLGWSLDRLVPELGCTLGEELLRPTRIYVRTALALLAEGFSLRALAHITGGGLEENIPRVLPDGCRVLLRPGAWPEPPVFQLLRRGGPVEEAEMRRVFNCGLGMVAVVPGEQADAVVRRARELGEGAQVVGEVVAGTRGVEFGC